VSRYSGLDQEEILVVILTTAAPRHSPIPGELREEGKANEENRGLEYLGLYLKGRRRKTLEKRGSRPLREYGELRMRSTLEGKMEIVLPSFPYNMKGRSTHGLCL